MSDLISRQSLIDALNKFAPEHYTALVNSIIMKEPSVEPEIIRCKDCRWWDRQADDSPMGYCHACKHGHYSRHWEISIIRTYEETFFCADAEPKEEGEEDE